MTTLRMNGLAGIEGDIELERFDSHGLLDLALEVHFDAGMLFIPDRTMFKRVQIKLSVEFPVDAMKHIQIERRRHSITIIVSTFQDLLIFDQIESDEESIVLR